ncbi:hypothetical protein Q667_02760 [Marinobacter sp. C1S70]|uniref:Uncharacterized protein n=1 Tax=Marinobacter nauticus TaxID=2743 RepID=A0A833JRJ5_MARNT|nr:hypothetical protein Q667_02760 [Marinobacter sp. C1S70]KAE8546769.1 hypothetical protein F6453_1010 [Marinobacter nauticus]
MRDRQAEAIPGLPERIRSSCTNGGALTGSFPYVVILHQ